VVASPGYGASGPPLSIPVGNTPGHPLLASRYSYGKPGLKSTRPTPPNLRRLHRAGADKAVSSRSGTPCNCRFWLNAKARCRDHAANRAATDVILHAGQNSPSGCITERWSVNLLLKTDGDVMSSEPSAHHPVDDNAHNKSKRHHQEQEGHRGQPTLCDSPPPTCRAPPLSL
jgi:hypothetical protein